MGRVFWQGDGEGQAPHPDLITHLRPPPASVLTAQTPCSPHPRPAVHCYYRSLPFSVGRHQFAAGPEAGGAAPGHPPFVSAVCWANRSRHCLAANSQGIVEVLHME